MNWVKEFAKDIRQNPLEAWSILFGIWLIDLLSTAIALGIYPSGAFSEGNPIAAYFFNLGVSGWLLWSVVAGLVIWGVIKVPTWFLKINLKGQPKDPKKIKGIFKAYNFLQVFFFLGLICSEGFIIIHNIILLFNY
jgi:hypothetical protein